MRWRGASGTSGRAVVLAMVAAALALAGCGSGDGSPRRTDRHHLGPAPLALDRGSGQPRISLAPGVIAVAAGRPITAGQLRHWMYIDAQSDVSGQPDEVAIVPRDPPRFTGCVADVRYEIPSLSFASTRSLQADCRTLLGSLTDQTLDFLIRADWYRAAAARLGLTPSAAQVTRALDAARRRSFVSASAYRLFIHYDGETASDIRLRVLIGEIASRLQSRERGNAARRAQALGIQLTRIYRPVTRCAAGYRIDDCG